MTGHDIVFGTDGRGRCLYTERVDLAAVGDLAVARATVVEYDNGRGLWGVRPADGGPLLFRHASREACLAWERQHLQTEEDGRHERISVGPGPAPAGPRRVANND